MNSSIDFIVMWAAVDFIHECTMNNNAYLLVLPSRCPQVDEDRCKIVRNQGWIFFCHPEIERVLIVLKKSDSSVLWTFLWITGIISK